MQKRDIKTACLGYLLAVIADQLKVPFTALGILTRRILRSSAFQHSAFELVDAKTDLDPGSVHTPSLASPGRKIVHARVYPKRIKKMVDVANKPLHSHIPTFTYTHRVICENSYVYVCVCVSSAGIKSRHIFRFHVVFEPPCTSWQLKQQTRCREHKESNRYDRLI